MKDIKAKIFHYNVLETLTNRKEKEIPLDNKVVFRFDDDHPDIEVSMDRVRNVLEIRTADGVLVVHPTVTNRIFVETSRRSI